MAAIEFEKLEIEQAVGRAGDDIVVDLVFDVMQDNLEGAVDLKLVFIPSHGEGANMLIPTGVGPNGQRTGIVMRGEQVLHEVEAAPVREEVRNIIFRPSREKFRIVQTSWITIYLQIHRF